VPCLLPAVTPICTFYVFAGLAYVNRFISGVPIVFFVCAGMNPATTIISAAVLMFNIIFRTVAANAYKKYRRIIYQKIALFKKLHLTNIVFANII